jgi:hypothetical protein
MRLSDLHPFNVIFSRLLCKINFKKKKMENNQLFVKMVFDRWNTLLKNCDTLIDTLSDEQLMKEIATGKNRGIYLLGHLIAVHDAMLPLLDLGEKQHADLYEIFVKSPDKAVDALPSLDTLRSIWKTQIATLPSKLESIATDDWFCKHTAVSAEEFEQEPNRNKLNIMLTRTTHLASHLGQMLLLK